MSNRPPFTGSRAIRYAGILLLGVFGSLRAQAQEQEGDLVYKFSVAGVQHHAEAKPVQYVLLGKDHVHACDFIEECACFVMASAVPLDRVTLADLLQEAQRTLSGPVEVSDGTVLLPPPPPER